MVAARGTKGIIYDKENDRRQEHGLEHPPGLGATYKHAVPNKSRYAGNWYQGCPIDIAVGFGYDLTLVGKQRQETIATQYI